MTDLLPANSIGGFDLSIYEDDPTTPRGINWQQAALAGIKFMWARATCGLAPDGDFPVFWKASKGEMPRGAYHFLYPASTGAHIMAQAQAFYDHIKHDPGEMPPCLDVEYQGKDAKGKPVYLTLSEVTGFITYLHQLMNPWPWKRDVLIYTGFYYWRDQIASTDPSLLTYDLWIAQYGTLKPSIPLPWTKSLFQQFTSNGDGKTYGTESLSVDLDVWDDTQDAFNAYCNLAPVVPPAPVPTPTGTTIQIMKELVITISTSDPNTQAKVELI
jgi:GH25 family lysozyme M1 (1,4-beta-N-acetylmuramidase)